MCRWIRTRAIYNPSTNRFFLTCSAVNHNFGGSLGSLSIDPKADGAQKMVQAIRAWRNAKEELESGAMSEDDYKSWKSSFRM